MNRVFVYGSLRKGMGNHRLLAGAQFVGMALTFPRFTMVSLCSGGYPGVYRGGHTAIVGEVYDVTAGELARLDMLEGHPRFYCRTPVEFDPDGEIDGRAEVYLLTPDRCGGYPRVTSGDWVASKANGERRASIARARWGFDMHEEDDDADHV